MAFIFFLMSALCFFAVIHPFVTYPLSLSYLKRRPIQFDKDSPPQNYAICMCAYNEEAVIEEKAQNLLALKKQHPNLSVYIYVDCASDNTAKILEKYSSFEQGIARINQSRFGLQAGIYTQSLEKMLYAWDQLQVGGVIINDIPSFRVDNMPYGGVKDSGLGREGIQSAIRDMQEERLLVIKR